MRLLQNKNDQQCSKIVIGFQFRFITACSLAISRVHL